MSWDGQYDPEIQYNPENVFSNINNILHNLKIEFFLLFRYKDIYVIS